MKIFNSPLLTGLVLVTTTTSLVQAGKIHTDAMPAPSTADTTPSADSGTDSGIMCHNSGRKMPGDDDDSRLGEVQDKVEKFCESFCGPSGDCHLAVDVPAGGWVKSCYPLGGKDGGALQLLFRNGQDHAAMMGQWECIIKVMRLPVPCPRGGFNWQEGSWQYRLDIGADCDED